MKGIKKIITSTVLIVMLLLLCVSCNNAVEETTGVGYINLSDVVTEGASRSLIEDDTAEYGVDQLYWTYTAEKTGPTPIRDTTGQTRAGEEVVVSYLGASDTDFSDHQGLSNKIIGPLAVGTWKIMVYGYLNNTEPDGYGYAAKKQGENVLIYTGETVVDPNIVACEKENARDRSKNKIEIQLRSPETLDGYLRFSANPAFTLKVPENMAFYSGSGATGDEAGEIVVKMIDVTAGNTKATGAVEVAVSRTPLANSTTYKPGDTITLKPFEFTDAVRDKIVELQDGTETYKYYSLATVPQVHKFEVIVEYKDSWTRRENEYASGTPRYNEDSFYDKDYAPVGDIITFPLKSVGGLKVVLSGDVNDIKANGGEVEMVKFAVADFAIVYWNGNEEDRTMVPLYFGTLQDAVNKWVEIGGMSDPERMRITVLRNISDGGVLNCVMADTDGNPDTPADTPITVPVPIHLNGFFIDKLTIDGGNNAEGSVIFCIPDTTSGQENVYSRLSRITISPYKEGDPATAVEPQVKNISYKVGSTAGGDAMVVTDIFLDGGDCALEARSNHTIYLSGKARNVKVGKTGTDYIPTVKLGTKTDCEVEELAVLGGKIEFGSWTKVAKLVLDASLATGSSLKGTASAYVGNLKDDIRYGNVAKPGQSASPMNSAQKAVFTLMTLKANNGTDNKRYLYGIEGMNIELPDFDTDSETSTWTKAEGEVDCTFMLWNTKDDVTGTSYDNCATLVTPKATETDKTNLYAVWAQPLGGKVFFINATGDWTDVKSYHFFGAQKKEMMQWQGSSDIAKALSGAVYALNTDTNPSAPDKVYVAYTNTDPKTSEGNVALYGESSQYNYFKDYGKATELKDNISIGAGKTNTETVLGVLPSADDNSVFWGIKKMRTDKVYGQDDWFIGCKAEYEKLTESTLARPQRITTLTVDGTGKVHTYTGDVYLSSWSLLPYGVDSRAFLVPLRSF